MGVALLSNGHAAMMRVYFKISPDLVRLLLKDFAPLAPCIRELTPQLFPCRQQLRHYVQPGNDPSESGTKLHEAFQLLEVDQGATVEQIKEAYIRMVKKYHPDSSSSQANAEKFSDVSEFDLIITVKLTLYTP